MYSSKGSVPDETHRLMRILQECIRFRSSQREVERTLGMGKGYLSQIIHGRVDPKIEHLLAVLKVIDIKPEEFFALAYPRESEEPDDRLGYMMLRELRELRRRIEEPESIALEDEQ